MKTLLRGLAAFACFISPSMAGASATINFGSTTAIPANNNFQSSLTALGLTRYAAGVGTSIWLDANSIITFYFLGSESGFNDTFQTANALPNLLTTESSSMRIILRPIRQCSSAPTHFRLDHSQANCCSPITVAPMARARRLASQGFGLFLGPNTVSGSTTNTFYFGYDDQAYNPDHDYDDFIIKAVVILPVPEPATWVMMLLGFGAIGFSVRRWNMMAKLRRKPAAAPARVWLGNCGFGTALGDGYDERASALDQAERKGGPGCECDHSCSNRNSARHKPSKTKAYSAKFPPEPRHSRQSDQQGTLARGLNGQLTECLLSTHCGR